MLLEQAKDEPHFQSLSKIQATAIADMCTDDLSSEIKGLLAVDVIQINWAKPEHPELILSKLASSDGRCAKKARRRRDQQNYNFLPLYLIGDVGLTVVQRCRLMRNYRPSYYMPSGLGCGFRQNRP